MAVVPPNRMTMACRRCRRPLRADSALRLGARASRYGERPFRCDACHVGYSNAASEKDEL
jgi:hypothetical protein